MVSKHFCIHPPYFIICIFPKVLVISGFLLEKKSVHHFIIVVWTAGMNFCHQLKIWAFILVFKRIVFPSNRKLTTHYLTISFQCIWSINEVLASVDPIRWLYVWVNSLSMLVIFKGFVHKISEFSQALLKSNKFRLFFSN